MVAHRRGRPVFVLGPGQDASTAVLVIVDRLRAECTDKTMARVLDRTRDRVRSAAAQRRVPRRLLEDAESDLLEIAAPRPLEEAAEDRAAPTEAGVSGAVRRVRTEPVTRARLRERRKREESPVKGARYGRSPVCSPSAIESSAGRDLSSIGGPSGYGRRRAEGRRVPGAGGFSSWPARARRRCSSRGCCGRATETIPRSGQRGALLRPLTVLRERALPGGLRRHLLLHRPRPRRRRRPTIRQALSRHSSRRSSSARHATTRCAPLPSRPVPRGSRPSLPRWPVGRMRFSWIAMETWP